MTPPTGPGLAKATRDNAVVRRELQLRCVREGWWARVLARADIVSEGGTVAEAAGAVYYGTTSLWCPLDDGLLHAPPKPAASLAQLVSLVLADGHARLRLLRLAHREAVVRAARPLGVLAAELSGRLEMGPNGPLMVVEIDVSAAVAAAERAPGRLTRGLVR